MHKLETPRVMLLIVATIAIASVLISGGVGWRFSHSPRPIVGHIDQPRGSFSLDLDDGVRAHATAP